jgi:hypothetical protein
VRVHGLLLDRRAGGAEYEPDLLDDDDDEDDVDSPAAGEDA